MANIKSQIKRIRTNEERRLRNKSVRSAVRTKSANSAKPLTQATKPPPKPSSASHPAP